MTDRLTVTQWPIRADCPKCGWAPVFATQKHGEWLHFRCPFDGNLLRGDGE